MGVDVRGLRGHIRGGGGAIQALQIGRQVKTRVFKFIFFHVGILVWEGSLLQNYSAFFVKGIGRAHVTEICNFGSINIFPAIALI